MEKMPRMKVLLEPKRTCLANCIKCGKPIIIMLPSKPIHSQRAQMVTKHECNRCGQNLYATTCTTGQAILAAHCSIVDGQMRFMNPVELEIEDVEGLTVTSEDDLLFPKPFVVGKGQDGEMTLRPLGI